MLPVELHASPVRASTLAAVPWHHRRTGGRARRRGITTGVFLCAVGGLVLSVLSPAVAPAATLRPRFACTPSPTTAFGAPQWTIGCHLGGQGFTSPVVGTIDGVKVVVDASLSGMVYVVNATTGAEMPGWPQPADLVGNTPTAIDSSPAIAYLDGPDAEPSIVVGLGSQYVPHQNGGVMAWNANGTVRFRFLTKKTFAEWHGSPNDWTDAVFATPAIGDLTGNGQQDIVFGSFDHYVYALNPEGKVLPGFPILRADTIWSSPALVDTTHTGQMDIIEGGDSSGWRGPYGGPECYSGWISDYRYVDGGPKLIWERCLAETVWSSPAVTTFGTTPVVVVGTSWFYGPGRVTKPAEDEVFAFNAVTGATMPGWPVSAEGPTFGSPAVGPLTVGGSTDVVESSCADCTSGPSYVSAWNQSGHLLWRDQLTAHSQVLASPSIVNLNGSSTNDVLIGNVAGLFVLSGANGEKIDDTGTTPINSSCNVGGTPVVSEVPGSATGYMMFTNCGFNGPTRPANEYLRAYNVPAPAGPSPWPMFRANPQRTGVMDPTSATEQACRAPKHPSGYEIATDVGAVFNYGASPYCGSLSHQLIPGAVAGIASTPNGGGYWLALADGTVYAFGDAKNYGDLRTDDYSTGAHNAAPGAPVVSIASTPDGKGYYLLGGDGSVYGFGDATYQGSVGDYRASGAPVSISVDDATGGYWIATSTGHVYNFDAPFHGSHALGNSSPIVSMAAASTGEGYWLVSADGAVYAEGSVSNYGSAHTTGITGITPTAKDNGYYLLSGDGAVYRFGSAPQVGDAYGRINEDPAIGIAGA